MTRQRKCESCEHIKLVTLSAKKSKCTKTGKEVYPKRIACGEFKEKEKPVRTIPIFKTECETNYWGEITVECFCSYGDKEISVIAEDGEGAKQVDLSIEKAEKMANDILEFIAKSKRGE